jgi:hypothetical protein
MNAAAEAVMKDLPDLVLAYGNSDEFRYVQTFHLAPARLRRSRVGKPMPKTTDRHPTGVAGDWSVQS